MHQALDLKDGYWQVKMRTVYCYVPITRHSAGIGLPGCHLVSSQPVRFFKKNEEAFAGIPGIHIVADDIIIAAVNIEEHDQILRQVLERANQKNITNYE